jgi:hypothetical protein
MKISFQNVREWSSDLTFLESCAIIAIDIQRCGESL